jgi:antitoxin component YwqK of YwqJK toxin-antitoxin module
LISAKPYIANDYQLKDDVLFFGEQPYSGPLCREIEEDSFSELTYSDGRLHGIQKTFYRTGELKKASIFTNGLENGRRVEYYKCGTKKLNANYVRGVQDGIVEEWGQNGMMKSRKTYYKGKLIAIMANP